MKTEPAIIENNAADPATENELLQLMAVTPPEQLEEILSKAEQFADTYKVPLKTALAVFRYRMQHSGDPDTPVPYPYPSGKKHQL